MTTWADHIRAGHLTVKHVQANAHQANMIAIMVLRCKLKGGDLESMAGTVATATQESTCTNLQHAVDHDSLGLFQQRPSMGWGHPWQLTNPAYAVDKFLSHFLPYRRRGIGWLEASDLTQGSAHSSAPAQWYGEALNSARYFAGAAAAAASSQVTAGTSSNGASSGGTPYTPGTTKTITREEPYEFSRGTADAREDSWTCIGRLAQEVGWRRYIARGALWFVSEAWLATHPPAYRLTEGARGVLSIEFDFETRSRATEATVKVTAGRYALAPGDVVELVGEGPADGKWLVSTTRRDLVSPVHELTLKRPDAKLLEPAPNVTQTTVTVGGKAGTAGKAGTSGVAVERQNPNHAAVTNRAVWAYNAAVVMSSWNLPYETGANSHRLLIGHPPTADCSSGVSWVLLKAGFPLPGGVRAGQWAPVSGAYEGWGAPGPGRYFTIMTNAGHIWIRWNGIGPAWRFDTRAFSGDSYRGSSGGRNRFTPCPLGGFVQRHWPGF